MSKASNQKTIFSSEKVNNEPNIGYKSVKLNVAKSKDLSKGKLKFYTKYNTNFNAKIIFLLSIQVCFNFDYFN